MVVSRRAVPIMYDTLVIGKKSDAFIQHCDTPNWFCEAPLVVRMIITEIHCLDSTISAEFKCNPAQELSPDRQHNVSTRYPLRNT